MLHPQCSWKMCPWNQSQLWGDIRSTVSCLRLFCTKKTLTDCRESPGWSWAGAHEVWEEVERAGLLQPGEERTEKDLLGLYSYLIEDYREDGASLLSAVRTENRKVTSCIKGSSNHMQGKKFSQWGQSYVGRGCPEMLRCLHPWRHCPKCPSQPCVEHGVGLQTLLFCKSKMCLLLIAKDRSCFVCACA